MGTSHRPADASVAPLEDLAVPVDEEVVAAVAPAPGLGVVGVDPADDAFRLRLRVVVAADSMVDEDRLDRVRGDRLPAPATHALVRAPLPSRDDPGNRGESSCPGHQLCRSLSGIDELHLDVLRARQVIAQYPDLNSIGLADPQRSGASTRLRLLTLGGAVFDVDVQLRPLRPPAIVPGTYVDPQILRRAVRAPGDTQHAVPVGRCRGETSHGAWSGGGEQTAPLGCDSGRGNVK